MKIPDRLLVAAAAALATLIPLVGADTPVPAETRATLAAFEAAHRQALQTGRVEALAGFLADDLRLMTEFQRTVIGREHALSYYRALVAGVTMPDYRREPIRVIQLGGSHVVTAGRFTAKAVRTRDGRASELIGKYLDLWRRSPEGKLVLVTQAWNYDGPVDIGDDLRFAEVPTMLAAFQARVPITTNGRFELAALGHLLEVAVSQHDAPLFARFYADDAILLPNYHAACVGRQEIDSYAAKHLPALSVFEKLDIRNDHVVEIEGYLIEYASHVANWRNGDASGVNTGKNLRLWRREPDHALKIIVQLGSYD